jgi:DNA-binding XRE family transcriptional regulator
MNDLPNALEQRVEALEDQIDVATVMLARIQSANQEMIPGDVIHRLIDGEPPLRVWREHRGWDHAALATQSGLAPATIAAIEQGAEPTLRDAATLARALGIDAEDLLPWPQD